MLNEPGSRCQSGHYHRHRLPRVTQPPPVQATVKNCASAQVGSNRAVFALLIIGSCFGVQRPTRGLGWIGGARTLVTTGDVAGRTEDRREQAAGFDGLQAGVARISTPQDPVSTTFVRRHRACKHNQPPARSLSVPCCEMFGSYSRLATKIGNAPQLRENF